MLPPEPRTKAGRISSLDGLRGIAILLVMASHLWTLVPTTWLYDQPALAWLFGNGNFAVSIFFVVAGFLVALGLLSSTDLDSARGTARWVARPLVRISASVYALLVVIMVISVLDSNEAYTTEQTRNSITRIMTYTWNWWVMRNALYARDDLGHLWYVSVYVQVMLCLAIAFFVLRRFRIVLLVALTAAMIASTIWRAHILDSEGVYQALLRTTSRMDGMLWGAMLAVALTLLSPAANDWLKRQAHLIAAAGLTGCLLLIVTMTNEATPSYFGWRGVVFNIAAVLVVAGLWNINPTHTISRALSWPPLVLVGAWSLSLFVWHYPIFWWVSRHSADWHWGTRMAVALAITALATSFSQRFIDAPVQRLLSRRLQARPQPTTHEV